MDYSKIDEGLYQGGFIDTLPSEINAVVNLRVEEADKLDATKVKAYAWLPIADSNEWPGDRWLDIAADVVATFRHAGYNVLVHCAAGLSRSTLVMCGYLIRHRAMTFDRAMAFIMRARPQVDPNPTFRSRLKAYSKRVRGK